jgi:hypothetical protein
MSIDVDTQKDSGVVKATFRVCGVDGTALWVVEWMKLISVIYTVAGMRILCYSWYIQTRMPEGRTL